jgi:sugar phosphate isomerase/epimerase
MIGTTSYGFRYLLMNPRRAPTLTAIVEQTRALGLDALQICENARPLELTEAQWAELLERARDLGLAIQLGCRTLRPDVLQQYLDRAARIPDDTVRIVLEEDAPPTRDEVIRFLDEAMPRLDRAGMKVAIENHSHVSCQMLAEVVAAYPPERVAFCVDSANSLRRFESADRVWELLGPRAVMYHLKDYIVSGSNVGFSVGGAPLGQGQLDVPGFLQRILSRDRRPRIYLENWVPDSGSNATNIAADRRWLEESLRCTQDLLAREPRPMSSC